MPRKSDSPVFYIFRQGDSDGRQGVVSFPFWVDTGFWRASSRAGKKRSASNAPCLFLNSRLCCSDLPNKHAWPPSTFLLFQPLPKRKFSPPVLFIFADFAYLYAKKRATAGKVPEGERFGERGRLSRGPLSPRSFQPPNQGRRTKPEISPSIGRSTTAEWL